MGMVGGRSLNADQNLPYTKLAPDRFKGSGGTEAPPMMVHTVIKA